MSGGVSAIDELTEGIKVFYDELRRDEMARNSAEVCIVTFGGTAPRLVLDFATPDRQTALPKLNAEGKTPMGEALNMALDCLERRKEEYKKRGVNFRLPWLVLMTDGTPSGSRRGELERAVQRTASMVNSKELAIFPVGIGDSADMSALARFSPGKPPLRLKETRFKEFFMWLGESVSRAAKYAPGDTVKLDVDANSRWRDL